MASISLAGMGGGFVMLRTCVINLTATLKLMRAVLPVMKAQGAGAIVDVSSAAGLCGYMVGVAYTSSKHGLVSERFSPLNLG